MNQQFLLLPELDYNEIRVISFSTEIFRNSHSKFSESIYGAKKRTKIAHEMSPEVLEVEQIY